MTKNWNGSFEWDRGNIEKNKIKHEVEKFEAEEVFFDEGLTILGKQVEPITDENRFAVIGMISTGKLIFVSFTTREKKLRVISARTAKRKERKIYEKAIH